MTSRAHRGALILGLAALIAAACAPSAAPGRPASAPSAAASGPGAAAGPGPAAPPVAREAFHLGYPNLSMSYLPILMARDLGYYDEEALDADVTLMRANVGQAALIAGEIE